MVMVERDTLINERQDWRKSKEHLAMMFEELRAFHEELDQIQGKVKTLNAIVIGANV